MSNHRIIFNGTEDSKTFDTELECYRNAFNKVFIQIKDEDEETLHIVFDKSTAIKFAKTLRTEINKIEDE